MGAAPDGSPGWIEIENRSGLPLDAGGMSLGVGARSSGNWTLPDVYLIPGGAEIVVLCDAGAPPSSEAGRLNTGLSLPASGTAIYLFDGQGREIDRVTSGFLPPGYSIGIQPGQASWRLLSTPTPGEENGGAAVLAGVSDVTINEWLAASGPDADDFVELFNASDLPVSLSGLALTDDLSISGRTKHTIAPLNFIGPRGFLAFRAGGAGGGGQPLPFNLDASGETLRLYDGFQIVDETTWGIGQVGVSSGRLPDGSENVVALASPSPGGSNEPAPPGDDTDGDGMPNAWEIAFGFDPSDPSDAARDADRDGLSNVREFVSGTDPTDGSSRFQIGRATHADGDIAITFLARPGVAYTVQARDSLQAGAWQTVRSLEPVAEERLTEVVDPAPTSPTRYYRIVASRPD
jgi:hypothetical protein